MIKCVCTSKVISLLLIVLILQGCASLKTNEIRPQRTLDLTREIYALLEVTRQGYRFTKFSDSPSKNGAWIKLSDLTPTWEIGKKQDCIAYGLLALTANNKNTQCVELPERFYTMKVDYTSPIGVVIGVATLGTAGLMAVLMVPATTQFDADGYDKAVSEADMNLKAHVVSSGMDYGQMIERMNSAIEEYKQSTRMKPPLNPNMVKPTITVIDRSGMNHLRRATFESAIEVSSYVSSSSFPVIETKNSFIDYMDSLLSVFNKERMQREHGVSKFRVKCSDDKVRDVNYKIKCPDSIASNRNSFDAEVLIDGITYNNIHPKRFSHSNGDIALTLSGGMISVENNTKEYVAIDKVSYYYRGQIYTMDVNVSMPAQSIKNIGAVNDFNVPARALAYHNINKSYAEGLMIDYGFSVGYKKGSSGVLNTLYSTNKSSLYELITNR